MKYVISEDRFIKIIEEFILSQLGNYNPNNSPIIGDFYLNGRLTARVYRHNRKVFVDIDKNVFNTIKNMFSINTFELDNILSGVFSDITQNNISMIYLVN
jgi:hypothetical protein